MDAKDYLGKTFKVGDKVAHAKRFGNSGRMAIGTVVSLVEKEIKLEDDVVEIQAVPCVKIEENMKPSYPSPRQMINLTAYREKR